MTAFLSGVFFVHHILITYPDFASHKKKMSPLVTGFRSKFPTRLIYKILTSSISRFHFSFDFVLVLCQSNAQLPAQFKDLHKFRYRQRTRRYDEEFVDDLKEGLPEELKWSQEAWQEGLQFAEARGSRNGRVKGQRDSPIEFVDSVGEEEKHSQFENAECSDTPEYLEGHRYASLLTSSNYAPLVPDSSLLDDLSVQSESKPSSAAEATQREPNTSVISSASRDSRSSLGAPTSSRPIFCSSDFPPLSSSDSESVGSPPRRTVPPPRDSRPSDLLSGLLRAQHAHSPLAEAAALPGRGRASALLRNAITPAARLPDVDRPVDVERYELRERRFEFPGDDELFGASQVT